VVLNQITIAAHKYFYILLTLTPKSQWLRTAKTKNTEKEHWESTRIIKRGYPRQPAEKLPAPHVHTVDRNNLLKDNFDTDFTETASLANPTIPRFPDSDYPILPTAFFTHDFTSILLCRNTYWAEFTSLLKFTKSMGHQWI